MTNQRLWWYAPDWGRVRQHSTAYVMGAKTIMRSEIKPMVVFRDILIVIYPIVCASVRSVAKNVKLGYIGAVIECNVEMYSYHGW